RSHARTEAPARKPLSAQSSSCLVWNPAYRPFLALFFCFNHCYATHSSTLGGGRTRTCNAKLFHGLCETTAGARPPASSVTLSALAWDQIRSQRRAHIFDFSSPEWYPPQPRYLWRAATSLRSMGHGPSRAGKRGCDGSPSLRRASSRDSTRTARRR